MHRLNLNLADVCHNFTHARPGALRPARLASSCAARMLFFAACTVGPNYVRPTAEVPTDFKETPANWKQAQPSDAVAKGKWWEIYQDSQLNDLEEQINVSNQTLKAEQQQFAQARAALRITRSNLFPNVSTTPSVSRTHLAPNEPLFNPPTESKDYNTFTIPVDVSYEPDLWGRVRRTVEASRSEAQATGADLANVSLSLHAELAGDYFQLRGLDAQKQLLDSNVEAFEKALDLTESRFHGGLASAVDVAQAKTILDTTRAETTDLGVQRAAFEHAIAVLIGKPASQFSLPQIPSGLPSDLLERRPDISAAERRVQEQNAQIGVARAAYFPQVTLAATGGFERTAFTTLLQGPSGFWMLGGQAAEYLFDGGARRGASEQAKAAWNQSV